ncbi:NAD(+)/NADH kinase, partial [Gammaproteobacteria bacterium]|nr:NAD(+)/NADH kinase [Gammaproteobacteria bacterium]
DLVEKVDLIIVFGGDGTLLNSARQYLDSQIPILGVNMGNVGFLTDLSVDNFETTIAEILSGNYKIEERNLVSAKFDDNHLYGLNEVVIHSGAYAQLMRYRLSVNNKVVYEQRSDGLIVATPTGSTAYSLSAGGPIIHPSLDVWTILPMLPQSLSSRPFIISSDENVEMELFEGPNDSAKICVDGQDDIDVSYGVKISISKMEKTLKLVHPEDNDFFEACREKLGWSLNISKS